MTGLRRGDVVLVPFDFSDRSGSKWRPAAVISSDRYNQETPDVLIASITGNLNAIHHPGDHRLADWQAAGLLKPSLLQAKLATVEAPIVGRRLGSLSPSDLASFERGLRDALGLG
jgi:mRNA interferase MazF